MSVTPEKIVVQDRDNRGHFLQWGYALLHYSYAELLHNKELKERKGKKGVTLRDIESKVHFIARLATPWQVGYMKEIEGVIMNVLHQ
jgi:hypothetical protein